MMFLPRIFHSCKDVGNLDSCGYVGGVLGSKRLRKLGSLFQGEPNCTKFVFRDECLAELPCKFSPLPRFQRKRNSTAGENGSRRRVQPVQSARAALKFHG